MTDSGKVYLVGAGCGDYDLITLRGKYFLEHCDVVIYDSLIDKRLLSYAPKTAEKICVGKRSGAHSETQQNINNLLVEKAKQGKTVVRLKGGDPFVFGRGGEEAVALEQNGIEYQLVPGVTSAVAVPELAGIPVTHRGISRSVHIVTGHTADGLFDGDIKASAKLGGTVVILMGLEKLDKIAEILMQNGKDENTPAAVISNGARSYQKIVRGTLKDIAALARENKLESPAVTVIGETAEMELCGDVSLPLRGVTVEVTGTQRFTQRLGDKLAMLGADVKIFGSLRVLEFKNNAGFDNALLNLNDYGWIALTSVNGVEILFNKLREMKIDTRALACVKFAAIGSGTAAALEAHGIYADLVPASYTSKALAESLVHTVKNDERVLILRAKQGSGELTKILDENNIKYDDIKTYDVTGGFAKNTQSTDTDFITFASASGVKDFFDCGRTIDTAKTKVASIGELTAAELVRHGVNDLCISKTSSISGIADIIVREVLK